MLGQHLFGGGTSEHEKQYEAMKSTMNSTLDAAKLPDGARGTDNVVGAAKIELHCAAFQVLILDVKDTSRTVQGIIAYLKKNGWRDNVHSAPENVRLLRGDWRFSIHTDEPLAAQKGAPPSQTNVELYLQSDAPDCTPQPAHS